MSYSKEDIKDRVEKALINVDSLYKYQEGKNGVLVNYLGFIEDIAEILLEKGNLKELTKIKEKDDKLIYNIPRDGSLDKNASKRITEKRIAICLYNQYKDDKLIGSPVHYETPLRTEGQGAIDLVYITNEYINLIELKTCKSKESLLRSVLEIFTYYKKLDKRQFLNEFKNCNDKEFQLVILLENTTKAYEHAQNIKEYKNLSRLIQEISNAIGLNIKICSLKLGPAAERKINKDKQNKITLGCNISIDEITKFESIK
ncbi:MAG: hypothetical protein PHC34_01570 [Candidatus Gastranaerophilales bacterium]|nr:hypothetical protein [Candidatus Gastranaerophilales bacterium]